MPSLIEIDPVVLEKFLNFVSVLSLVSSYLSLEKSGVRHLKKKMNLLHPMILSAKFSLKLTH